MKFKTLILFLSLFALGMFLSLNMNSKYKIYTYKSAMWADASGYYMYLPATFIYHWDFERIPKGMDSLTGLGFYLRQNKEVIFTKYTSGQAFLHFPFFAAAHLFCKISGSKADGFSQPYVNSLIFAGVFYMLAALFILYRVLRKYFDKKVCLITEIALFLCTNLYYYSIKHPGLTHIYTFFLVSLLLYLIQNFSAKRIMLILPLSALVVLVRPTNITLLFVLLIFGIAVHGKEALKKVPLSHYLTGFSCSMLIFLPQLFYWHYASGNWFMYSYEDEGFVFWKEPRIMSVLFAPHNGFFIYSPLILFALIGFYFKPVTKVFSIGVVLFFCVVTYIHGSWHSPGFGCAYGGRAYIDFYPLFAFGLAAFINFIYEGSKTIKLVAILIMACFAVYNVKFIYSYDDCWHSNVWDYDNILRIMEDASPQ